MKTLLRRLVARVLDRVSASLLWRLEGVILEKIYRSTTRVSAAGQPHGDVLAAALRELAAMRWSVKVLGSQLAERLYAEGRAGPGVPLPPSPIEAPLTSRLLRQADIEQPWLRHWCGRLGLVPRYQRKVWEYAYVLQALWQTGMLEPGKAGVGFATGMEPLPSFFAGLGIDVMATDLDERDERALTWENTGQHASGSIWRLHDPRFVTPEAFSQRVSYRAVDMERIPAQFAGRFDFCWSICSFEHIGSVEKGLQFVIDALECVKPGGIAVHTTEFSFEPSPETLDNWHTVLFQARHMHELAARLAALGHTLMPLDLEPGTDFLDSFVDLPPYPWQPQPGLNIPPDNPGLRFTVDGFPAGGIGLIIRKAG